MNDLMGLIVWLPIVTVKMAIRWPHTHTHNARINWKSINYRRYLYVSGHLCTSINCIDKINQIRPIWNEFLTFSKWMPLTFRLNFEARRFTDTVYSDYFSWNLIENFRISSEYVNISFKNIFVTNNSLHWTDN